MAEPTQAAKPTTLTAFEQVSYIADIPLHVNVELAHITMRIRDILALSEGSVIKTNRAAGENINILIGGAPVGSGEVVIIEETVGVRITDFTEER
jgi:flagellar motor switch protein FliN/FliY